MAEGGALKGVFEDREEQDRERSAVHLGADPLATTLAMGPAPDDPTLARRTGDYLERQGRLVEKQERLADLELHHFDLEHRLDIEAAKRKRFGDRLRNGLSLFVAMLATGAAVTLAVMTWDAAHDHSLVVEVFSVPPDLAQRGLTGQVVAKQVLDKLTEMQALTETMRPAGSYKNNWGAELKVEIPETGVSLGELRQYLHAWLGHETHVTGEVVRTAGGLTVTARAEDGAAKSIGGPDAAIDTLIRQAAESVYEQTQPYRFAVYLSDQKRHPEALAVLARLTHDPRPLERAWAHLGLGAYERVMRNEPLVYARELRRALSEYPSFAPALADLSEAESMQGHDGLASHLNEVALRTVEAHPDQISDDHLPYVLVGMRAYLAETAGDFRTAIHETLKWRTSQLAHFYAAVTDNLAGLLVADHDLKAARAWAANLALDNSTRWYAFGWAALEDHDRSALGFLQKARTTEMAGANGRYVSLRSSQPNLAVAEARFGDEAAAKALIDPTPLDCYGCVDDRGIIAAARGDRSEAERWFAEAIRLAPDLPLALKDRAEARLSWNNIDGALEDVRHAHTLGPHYADPLKLWGDALAGKGDWRRARSKYRAALAEAPNWAALRAALRRAEARG